MRPPRASLLAPSALAHFLARAPKPPISFSTALAFSAAAAAAALLSAEEEAAEEAEL